MIRILVFWFALSCAALAQSDQSPIVGDPPKDASIPNIINSFAAKEKDFKQALEQYTYTRDVTVTASCQGKQPGSYHLIVDVGFDRKGNRVEKVKAVSNSTQCIAVTKEDLDKLRNQTLPVLTPDEIRNYQINFVGQQQQDNLHFYVFDVSPIAALSKQYGKQLQYFEGRIWVDVNDFSVVKTQSTAATKRELKHWEREDIFPAVTTWREQIDGRYWFPTQSRATGVLRFSTGDVQIDEVVKLTDYKAVGHP
jgi:hypothetical protein